MERSTSSIAGSKRSPVALGVGAGLLGFLCWVGGAGHALAAGTFVVDGANPGCSDTAPGAGTEGNPPYCTIAAAAKARGGPGTTILVKPAIYRERVTVTASGAEGSPFVIQALGPGVVVDGADNFSDPGLWTPLSGTTVWLAASVTWAPKQVFVDGAGPPLRDGGGLHPASLIPGLFRFIPGEGLYVNLGGDNPGTHQTLVGRRANGFYVPGRAFVTIDGFTVTRTEDRGIYVRALSNNTTITHNTVTFANRYGIAVEGVSNALIGANVVSDNNDHGISLSQETTGSTIQDNEVFRNRGDGLRLFASPGNLLQRNAVHDNGTGIAIIGTTLADGRRIGSDNTLSLQNRSWRNYDGFHHRLSTGTLHVGDVAWGNANRGISVEADATGTHIFNSIAVNNWLNLVVDSGSASAFVSNYNIWSSTSSVGIRFGTTTYATLIAFTAATGQDANSIQADPQFVHPVGGDFRLLPGSPAIDAADSSVPHWPEADAAGQARVDDPATANTGVDPVPYADRGALEFLPFGPPLAALTVTPSAGNAPLAVTADASRSVDPDGTIVSYRFDFGGGTVVGPQPEATASHTYAAIGTFMVSVTVTDDEGRTAAASHPIRVNAPPEGRIDTPAGNITVGVAQTLRFRGTGTDPDGDEPLSYFWDFGGGAGNKTGRDPGLMAFYVPGIYTVTFTVTDSLGLADPTPDSRVLTVGDPNQAPNGVIDTPASDVRILAGQSVTFSGTGGDPDGHLPLTYRWDFGGAANQTVEDPGPVVFGIPGTYIVQFTVTDSLGVSDPTSDSRMIVVAEPSGGPNLVGNPSFESDMTGWGPYGGATLQRVPGGQEGAFALEVQGPATTTEFGINDSPNWVGSTGSAGTRYRFSAWVRAAASTGRARLKVREYLNGVQVGGTTSSPFQPLTPDWKLLSFAHVTQAAGSTLDFQVLDTPSAPGQVFQVDSISIRIVTATTNQPPNGVIDSPAGNMTITAGQSVNFSGTGTDPDGNLPLSYRWDFGGGAANQTVEDPGPVVFSTPGSYTVRFTVTDSVGVSDSSPDSWVIKVVPANFVGNPSFESDTRGWKPYPGSDTVMERVPGGQDGAFALEVRGPASTTAFGINDSPNWVGSTLAAGTRYRFSAWVRAEASSGRARLRVREYLNGVQVGAATVSPSLALMPDWQLLLVDHVAQAASSTLDFQMLDAPVAPGEVFQTDNIAIQVLP